MRIGRRSALLGLAATGFSAVAARAQTPDGPPALEVYARSPGIDAIALSPDGTRVTMVTQHGDDKYLLNLDLDSGAVQQIAMGSAKIRDVMWADDNHVMVTSSVTQRLLYFGPRKHELYMARIVNIATLEVKALFSGNMGFYEIVMGQPRRVKAGDDYRIIAANAMLSEPYPMCLYSFEMDKSVGTLITVLDENIIDWVLASDGQPLACSGYAKDDNQWAVFALPPAETPADADKAKGAPRKVYSHTDKDTYPMLVGLCADGKSFLLHIAAKDEDGDYYELSPDGKLSAPLDAKGVKAGRTPLFHPTTWRFCGFMRRDDWKTYDYTDPELAAVNAKVRAAVPKDCRYSVVDFAEDPSRVIIYSEGKDDAGSYRFMDTKTGKIVKLPRNYPDLAPDWISEKQAIVYKASDGLDIHGYLTLPPKGASKNLPLIVLPHGGPQLRDYGDFDWQAQAFASRGYVVLQPNFRGSSGYGITFVKAGHGEWGRKMQTDLSDGVRWLVAQRIVDPKRVAIVGASYGGYAALAGATVERGVYNCAVSIAGVSDLASMLDYVASQDRDNRDGTVTYFKTFFGGTKGLDGISPLRRVQDASCPILLIHGQDDTVVPVKQSQRMADALRAAHKPVEFITYKGQDHWETIESARLDMMRNVMAFLAKHNPA